MAANNSRRRESQGRKAPSMLARSTSASGVGAWLATLPVDLSMYTPKVMSEGVTGSVLFNENVDDILDKLAVSSASHRHVLRECVLSLRGRDTHDDQQHLEDEANIISNRRLLISPKETIHWLTLKEGYLTKTKVVKGRFHKSTKLRWFVLKQHPETKRLRLEYYEGVKFKGGASLDGAFVIPDRDGAFAIETSSRTFYLQAEKGNLGIATGWVLALQRAISRASPEKSGGKLVRSAMRETILLDRTPAALHSVPSAESAGTDGDTAAATAGSADSAAADPPPSPRRRGGARMENIDGDAIDRARWNAIRKANCLDPADEVAEVDRDDDDVRLLRELEEEEERRQEEERLAFLAERAARKAAQEDQQRDAEAASAAADAKTEAAEVAQAEQGALEGAGSESEDDEEFLRQMQEAEEEEERRQEEERLAFLASRAAAK